MKIAVVTDDGQTISAHFGRASHFLVATLDEGQITGRELRAKTGHQDFVHLENGETGHELHHDHENGHEQGHEHGRGAGAQDRHARMFATVADCSVVLARGMGMGAYEGLQAAGIRPIVTTVAGIDDALEAFVEDRLEDHPEKLH
jgi:predicted Fe-Mo cluster-binding NifX family protein